MSDGERGPYTPQKERDAPLQFDARGPRDAKPMPMALIASAAVLVVLVGAVAMAYLGGGSKTDAAGKAVGDRVLVMKTPPAPGANPTPDPDAKLEVFSDHPGAAAPTFVAAPEAPAPRPAPRLQLREQTLPPVRIGAAETPSVPASARVSAAAKPVAPVTEAAPATKVSTPVAATSLSTAKATTPKIVAPVTTAASTGSVGAQIGAFSSRSLAEKGFADVGRLVSTTGRGKRIEAVEREGSTLYRTTVTGFADRDAAKAFCAGLAAKGHACIVKS